MDRHDLDLAGLGQVALLLRGKEAREVREARPGLGGQLEFARRTEHVRKARLAESVPRDLRIFRQLRAQIAQRADKALRRECKGHLARNGRGLRESVRMKRRRERGQTEMTPGHLVARMVRQLDEIQERRERRRVENGALALPDDALDAQRLESLRKLGAKGVRTDEDRRGEAASHRIDRTQGVRHRLDEVLHLGSRRVESVDEAVQLRPGRFVFGTLPGREFGRDRTARKHTVHGFDDSRTRAVRLHQLAELIAPALLLSLENRHVAVAPAVDRLLAVADDEDRLLAARLLRLVHEITQGLPLFAARVLELIQRPCANARIETILKCEALVHPKAGDETRHVAEDQLARVTHARGIVLLERLQQRVDAAGEFELATDDIAVHAHHRRADLRRRLTAIDAVLVLAAAEIEFNGCPRENLGAQLDELLGEARRRERAAEMTDPINKLLEVVRLLHRRQFIGRRGEFAFGDRGEGRRRAPDRSGITPGLLRGLGRETLMPAEDELAIGFDKAPDVLTVHRQRKGLGERLARFRIRPSQDRERDARLLLLRTVLIHHLQLADESELQREGTDDLHQEAVERSDLREMLRGNHLAQQGRVRRILFGARREQRHETFEDLTRRGT